MEASLPMDSRLLLPLCVWREECRQAVRAASPPGRRGLWYRVMEHHEAGNKLVRRGPRESSGRCQVTGPSTLEPSIYQNIPSPFSKVTFDKNETKDKY